MMMTVYDPQGVPHTVEAVDGREYLKSGHYTTEPAVDATEVTGPSRSAPEAPELAEPDAAEDAPAVDATEVTGDAPARRGRKPKSE